MGRRRTSPVNELFGFSRRQSIRVKTLMGVVIALCALVALKFLVDVRHRHYFFVAAEAVHAAGILILVYKLTTKKTCSGLSLKSQEITAIFLAVRLVCSLDMSTGIHTWLDFATLISTLWVIYMMRFKLKSTYIKELDNMRLYYVVVPSAILALLIHPFASYMTVTMIFWAFSVFLESVSVLPQLRMMQKAKMIEPFTSHYVFALGIARFLSCAHWIIQVYDTRGQFLFLLGSGWIWFPMALLAELVQTFILADFCYYYIKRFMQGQLLMRMPV